MTLIHKPEPRIVKPLTEQVLTTLQEHVKQVRRTVDWPGIDYHDANVGPNRPAVEGESDLNRPPPVAGKIRPGVFVGEKFNRWFWHNLPLLVAIHNDAKFIAFASAIFNRQLKPSYSFLSMYGPDGVCPLHQDRPQCQYTVDLQVHSNGDWPIYVDEKPYVLKDGESLCYSGTGQPHYRKPMSVDGKRGCTSMDLAFFHFVPVEWQGKLS